MTSMIERVAKALATADGKDPDGPAWVRYPGPEFFGICWRDQYSDKARAAIEAMMDPTEGMKVSGAENLFGAAHDDWRIDATAVWQAMITAALKENGE